MVIAAHGRGQYLIIRCCWAFGTGCLQNKAEPRTLTDMTFLKFAAIYVSLLPLFLFYISPASLFLAFFFPRAHSTLPPSPCTLPRPKLLAVRSRQSSSSFLFYLLFLPLPLFLLLFFLVFCFSTFRPHVSLARFISPPRSHPVRRTSTSLNILERQREKRRRGGESEGKRVCCLSFSVPQRIVLLFAVGLLAPFERANERTAEPGARTQATQESASFLKLKTGLSAFDVRSDGRDSLGEASERASSR